MTLRDIGEDGLIEYFKKGLFQDSSVVKGIGDDAAVVKFGNKYLLFTCDILIEGTHFLKSDPPVLIGRKSISASISDIAAMGGVPKYAVVSLGLPRNLNTTYVFKLWQGIKNEAANFKVSIVGGDTVRAKHLTIDVAILGEARKETLVFRSSAKAGDIILVSGSLGGSLRGRHLNFRPRLKEAQFLVNNFKLNSMIDLSDSLIKDLSRILKESGVGACLFEELIPIHKDARNLDEALFMGEDFELLFTLSLNETRRLMRKGRFVFYPIGEITAEKKLEIYNKKLSQIKLKELGFRHF